MIKEIQIQNFQSHSDSVFSDLSKGLNVIIGHTGAGKSAALRAVRSVLFNKMKTSFISNWGGECSVTLTLENDCKVKRVRSKSKNEYWVDKLQLTSFKTEVPKEVCDALNLGDVSYQSQFDPFYLIRESSGKVASHFNKVAGLDVIDTATASISAKIRETSANIKTDKKELEILDAQLIKYVDLDIFEKEVKKLERKRELYKEQVKSIGEMSSLLDEIKDIDKAIRKQEGLSELKDIVENICMYHTVFLKNKKEAAAVDTIVKHIKYVTTTIKNIAQQITEDTNKLSEIMPDVCPICNNTITK